MDVDEERIRAACEVVGIDAAILISALFQPPPQGAAPPPTEGRAVHRMGQRRSPISRNYVPLSTEELEILETVFTVGKQARVPGSVLLNTMLERVTTGKTLEAASEASAVYMRMRRSFRRREFAALRDLVASRPDVFSEERLKAFEAMAATEVAYRSRNGWDAPTSEPLS